MYLSKMAVALLVCDTTVTGALEGKYTPKNDRLFENLMMYCSLHGISVDAMVAKGSSTKEA